MKINIRIEGQIFDEFESMETAHGQIRMMLDKLLDSELCRKVNMQFRITKIEEVQKANI